MAYLSTPKVRFHVFLEEITKNRGVIMVTLYERLNSLCEEKGIKGGKMCTELGFSKSLMTDLKKGRKKSVSAETAQKIATYFGVSVGYLLGEEEKKQSTESELSIKKKEFIQKVEKMTDAQIERLEQILALVEKTDL
jgi:transcriptional regulator with XRE-family HTH domain